MRNLLLLFTVSFFLINCKKIATEQKDLLHYVPENASVLIKISDHQRFLNSINENSFLSDLGNLKTCAETLRKIAYLKYISPNSTGILSFTEVESNGFEFSYVTENSIGLFRENSNTIKNLEAIEFEDSRFEKYEIEGFVFYTLKSDGKIILSSSKLLLEQIDNNETPDFEENFDTLYTNIDNNKAVSIFINIDRYNGLLSTFLNDSSKLTSKGILDWASLDFNAGEKKVQLNGISIANDSTRNFIDLFTNTKPTSNEIIQFAPNSADAVLSYTFDSYSTFTKNRELLTGNIAAIDPLLDPVEEVGIIYINNQKVAILNTYGSETIADYLKNHKKSVSEFMGYELLEIQETDFLTKRFSPIITNFNSRFFTVLEDAFLFADNENILKSIITDYKGGGTFENGAIYTTVKDGMSEESTILFLANGKIINKICADNFSTSFAKDIKTVDLSGYAFAAQTVTDKKLFHLNILVQKTGPTKKKSNTSTLFTLSLDADIATNPQFVTNHQTKKTEIVVQDQKNVLYLISEKGEILWKKQLKSRIQGKIQQVDIFKNGRLQLAFTTNNKFMVLDRNGKEASKFTKTFTGGNLNPLAVFDYERKKDYRFVITQNNNVFMYNNKARIVKGFKFTKANQDIIASPKHLVIGNKDFLVFKLKDGSLKLLNRVGNDRIIVNQKIDFSENEVFLFKDKFILTNKKGVLFEIDGASKISKKSLDLSNGHGIYSTKRTLVTMNDNILHIKGKKIELEMGVYTKPHIFHKKNKIYVSVTDLQNEKVYLFDSQATPIAGFPLFGISLIDLHVLRNNNINIVSKKNNTTLISYSIK